MFSKGFFHRGVESRDCAIKGEGRNPQKYWGGGGGGGGIEKCWKPAFFSVFYNVCRQFNDRSPQLNLILLVCKYSDLDKSTDLT